MIKIIQEQSCLALAECMLSATTLIGNDDAKMRFVRAVLLFSPFLNVQQETIRQIFLSQSDIREIFEQI